MSVELNDNKINTTYTLQKNNYAEQTFVKSKTVQVDPARARRSWFVSWYSVTKSFTSIGQKWRKCPKKARARTFAYVHTRATQYDVTVVRKVKTLGERPCSELRVFTTRTCRFVVTIQASGSFSSPSPRVSFGVSKSVHAFFCYQTCGISFSVAKSSFSLGAYILKGHNVCAVCSKKR